MESSQLIPEELVSATFLTNPTEITTSVSDINDGLQQNVQVLSDSNGHSQLLQVLASGEAQPHSLHVLSDGQQVAVEDSVGCGHTLETGLNLLQPGEESLWVNSQIQYVVIHRDDLAGTGEGKPEIAALVKCAADEQIHEPTGFDKLQCGLCGKYLDNVKQFLHHKSTHVGRGMGLGCELCGLSFSRQLALTQHYKQKHKLLLAEKQQPSQSAAKHSKRPPRKPGTAARITHQNHTPDLPNDLIKAKGLQNAICYNGIDQYSDDLQKKDVDVLEDTSEAMLEDKQASDQVCDIMHNAGDINSVHDSVTEARLGNDNVETGAVAMYGLEDKGQEHFNEDEVLQQEEVYKNIREESQMLTDEIEDSMEDDMNTNAASKTVTISSVTIPKIVHVAETDLNQADGTDAGNSNSSEKENTVNNSENAKVKLVDAASEKMIKLSHSLKDLANELDMPDFHFIPVIERKHKKSRVQGGRYSFRCLYCGLKVSWRSTLCRHMKEKHADILKVGPLLNIPESVNGEEEVMKMSDYIKLETRPSGKRVRGVESQDLPGEYLCDKCDKVFNRLRYLRKHQIVHKTEKKLLCSECVKSFRTLANLKQHMKTHQDRESYKCGECDFESTVNIAIHTHRQLHSQGCVLCEVCGSAYTDRSTLTKHKQVHNPLRPFACQYSGCTWRFKTKAMAAAHFHSHTSEGKFVCSVCGYAFRQKHHLQRHEKTIHNIVPERKPSYSYLEPTRLTINREVEDGSSRLGPSSSDQVQEVSMVINEGHEVSVDTVVDDQFDLESALQSGQLVIATEDGGTINYEMSDIGMSMSYQTLLHDGDGNQLDAHAILVPHSDGSQIVYQHEEVAETVHTEDIQDKA